MNAVTRWQTTSAGEETVLRWWRGEYGLRGRFLKLVLAPAEALFRLAVWLRNAAYDAGALASSAAPIPIISVGNLAIGGTGKTPVSAWLLDELLRRGHQPALLHGGYASDEPALHRQWHPEIAVFANRDRLDSARRAHASGSTIAVLDDGFQYRRLRKDLEVLLVAAETWRPHPRLLPNGPWRESPSSAVRRADLVIVTRKTATAEAAARVAEDLRRVSGDTPVATLYIRPSGFIRGDGAESRPEGAAIAVAGVAQPELFVENARSAGASITGVLVFPDHHAYDETDAERVRRAAGGRAIVTTAKDYVKLRELIGSDGVWVLRQEVEVDDGDASIARALDALTR